MCAVFSKLADRPSVCVSVSVCARVFCSIQQKKKWRKTPPRITTLKQKKRNQVRARRAAFETLWGPRKTATTTAKSGNWKTHTHIRGASKTDAGERTERRRRRRRRRTHRHKQNKKKTARERRIRETYVEGTTTTTSKKKKKEKQKKTTKKKKKKTIAFFSFISNE